MNKSCGQKTQDSIKSLLEYKNNLLQSMRKEQNFNSLYCPKNKEAVLTALWWYHYQGVEWAWCDPENNVSHPSERVTLLDEQLQSLKYELECFKECRLIDTAQHTVFSDGNPASGIMAVGEAPGAEEDRLGKPFVGASGQLLDSIFQSVGWTRDHIYITNVVPWRPPMNRQPSVQEIQLCLPFLQRHIALVKPKVLLLFGAVAARSLLGTMEGMAALQQKELFYKNDLLQEPIRLFVFYHPAYLLRSPGQKRAVWHQMIRLQKFLNIKY